MAAALSPDLRSRVIAAVDGGATRHAAAERFGIGVATAIRWLRAWRDEGRLTALPMGGDVRSHRIEAFGDVILTAVKAQKDITLAELADMLQCDHGALFASSTAGTNETASWYAQADKLGTSPSELIAPKRCALPEHRSATASVRERHPLAR